MAVTKTLVPGGHAFVLDEDGEIKNLDFGDYHDGYWCAKCDDYFCRNCHPNILKEQCPEQDETLPGLEYD